MWMKPFSCRRMSFGMWRDVRVSPCRNTGISALRKRISSTNARRFASAGLSSGRTCASSSSSIDRMNADARLCCCAKLARSP